MTNNLSARNDRNNDSSLQVDQQCFCVRSGLGTCVGKHAFELLAFVGRACVRALTMFTLAGMAPGCIWAHRPRSTLLALIYRLPCNLELCWAWFSQPLKANRPPLWLPCWQPACANVHKHSVRCVAMSGGPVHTPWPFGLSVFVCPCSAPDL